MWFGTKDGLNRFDGKYFKIYRKQKDDIHSIGHNFIHCIKEDSKKRLLIGTRNGVYQYKRDTDNFQPVLLDPDSTKQINVNDILEDSEGHFWVACHGEGLYKLSPDLVVEEHYISNGKANSIPVNFIWTIICDNYGNLWLGTAGKGLVHFDKKNEKFTLINNREGLKTDKQSIYSIYCDKDNSLWIGTYTNGLFKYNYINGEASHYLQNTGSVKAIMDYSDNELIMGSEKGLIIFNKDTKKYDIIKESWAHDNITDNSIFSIIKDKEGAFWIGTYFSGVNYFSPSTNKFLYFNSLSEKSHQRYIVSSVEEDPDGHIMIATHNNNIIYRYNPVDKSIEKAFEMEYHNIQSMLRDGDNLYVSIHGRGINILSLRQKKVIEKINMNTIEGKSLFRASNGNVIFSLEEGGCAYRQPDGNIKRIKKLLQIPIVGISEDQAGNLWFVTNVYGLFCLTPKEAWDELSGNPDNYKYVTNNNLTCLFCDKKNRIWIGTKNEGIIVFNPSEKKIEKKINEINGLPSNIIYTILNDKDDNIWATTGKGIVKIDGRTNSIKPFAYIGKEIQYNSFCALRTSNNQLFFGGTNGFISLNPDELASNEEIPNVVLTRFRIFNKEVYPNEESSPLKNSLEHTTEIVLKHYQSNFSFDFASLSYVFPENNQYAYMLEGFDKDWNYVTDNTAQYMNIPPGKYVFRVKGANSDSLWNDNDTNIIIRIKPPFWLEYYMIIIYVVIILGLILYLIKRYNRFLNRKNQEKQYQYQIIKEREMYESKINFFTNIAHEIRTPLSLITAPLENIIRKNEGSDQTQKNLQTIERNTNRLLDLVNQLLDFRKIENDMFLLNLHYQDIIKIIKKVYDQYYQDVKILNIEMNIYLPEDKILGFVDAEALYKIISNLISNAIKFTKNRITVKVESNDEMLSLFVEDNGQGIKEDYLEKIFEPFYQIQVTENENYTNKGSGLGLSLSQSLAKKLGGKISVLSNYGKNTTFMLELPIIKNKNVPEPDEEYKFSEIVEADEPEVTGLMDSDDQTILIVEDNEELRSFMIECLAENYRVLEAENGIEALDTLEHNMIDVVISDILMPKMNGLELCNEVKTNPAYSHLPFILLSAKTDTLTKIDGLKKGADVYMEKPFSTEQLKAQITSIIDNRINLQKKFIKSPLQYIKKGPGNNESVDFVNKLNKFILENMSDEKFSIDNLSSEFAISRTNFQKKIKSITGLTPNDYIKLIRLNKSAELLSTGSYRVNEVCIIVGFNTPSYFSKCFFEHFGKLPKDFMTDK